jgi:CubicO group peptidase (beta-lactamase class C family)
MRPVSVALLLLILTPRIQAQDGKAAAFDAYVTKAVKDWGAVGLAIAVVKDGQMVFAKGYGVRQLGTPDAVDPNTLFAIGSTTKAITAAALGMLVDDGKVHWYDPVAKFLPDFQLADPYITRNLTVRDLLTHDAGLANADVLWYETDNTPDEVLRRARFIPIAYSMRSSFIYQNIMYSAAGAVVSTASGMPWQEFVRTRILAPLGMTGTALLLSETAGRPNVASPHDRIRDTLRVISNASVDAVAPAGSIWSSVSDMSRWLQFMIDSGRVAGKPLLQPATWAELLTPQTLVTPSGFYPTAQVTRPQWTTYGLGWFQHDYAGRKLDLHTGSIDGMVAIAGIIPAERFGVYILANLDHLEVRHALLYQAIDHWLGTGTRDWSAEFLPIYQGRRKAAAAAEETFARQRVSGTQPSLALEKYAGTYADSLAGSVRVTLENGALKLLVSSRLDATLAHWNYDTFRGDWSRPGRGQVVVTFGLDARAAVTRLEMRGITYRRVTP